MVRTVERIEQELALLDQSIATIAQEFHDTYSQYLAAFGQAVRQQLILASYHLCTHGYPEHFLKLSLSQRQQLQQSLRQLAKTAQTKLLDRLQSIESSKSAQDASLLAPALGPIDQLRDAELEGQFSIEEIVLSSMQLDSEQLDIFPDEQLNSPDLSEPDLSEPDLPEPDLPEPESTGPDLPEPESTGPESTGPEPIAPSQDDQFQPDSLQPEPLQPSPAPEPPQPRPTYPKDLIYWQEQLEESIVEELQGLSHAANRLLQQAEILPGRLPEPVLEVAAKADIASESAVSPPNLLNLLIETEDEDEKESTMTQLMAIRLRLSEIEFSDSASTIWRSRIRDLSTRLNKLGREYQKKQKERSIAQAESAWRSSWYED